MNNDPMSHLSKLRLRIHCISVLQPINQCLKNILPSCEIISMTLQSFDKACEEGSASAIALQTDMEYLVADIRVILIVMKWKTSNLKFVQSTFAGIDALLNGFKELNITTLPFRLCRFSGDCFGNDMSDYVICNTMNWIRRSHEFKNLQREKKWDCSMAPFRQFRDLTIGILGGTGAIGSIVSKNCKALGAEVWIMGREMKNYSDICDYAHEFRTVENISDLLENCDVICSILPCTEATTNLLNLASLEKCVKKPLFINVGRSNVIGVDQLMLAMEKGILSGLVLDVFDEEPLSPDSKLWKMPGVVVTPHIAAYGNAKGIADFAGHNLKRFIEGMPLMNEIDFRKSY